MQASISLNGHDTITFGYLSVQMYRTLESLELKVTKNCSLSVLHLKRNTLTQEGEGKRRQNDEEISPKVYQQRLRNQCVVQVLLFQQATINNSSREHIHWLG